MTEQYLRSCSLQVGNETGSGIELAGLQGTNQVLRIRFIVNYQTVNTPANLEATVYNLSATTIANILSLAGQNKPNIANVPNATSARIILKAGYIEDQKDQTIFTGQIYQIKVGKENATDSYLRIFAADGDIGYNHGVCNVSLPKGHTPVDQWNHAGQALTNWAVTPGTPPDGLSTTASPRGKVLYGRSKDILRDLSNTHNFVWNVLGGKLVGLPVGGSSGDAIIINHETGQINVPEQTEQGVSVTTLLNAQIRWGSLIHLNNTEIAQYKNSATGTGYLAPTSADFHATNSVIPPLNTDGFYVALRVTHVGDTRNNEWYTKIVCLSANPTDPKPLAKTNVEYPPLVMPSGVGSDPNQTYGAGGLT